MTDQLPLFPPPAVLRRGEFAVTRPHKFAVKTSRVFVDAAALPCSPARRGTQSSDPPVVDDTTAAPSALPCALGGPVG